MTRPDWRQAANSVMLPLLCFTLGACGRHDAVPPQKPNSALPAIRHESHLAAGGILPAGGELHNPHTSDSVVAKNGSDLFASMNCDGCHGGDAAGWVGPRLSDGRWKYGGSDPEVFMSIYYGRPNGMPAFGGALGTEGVWVLVTYLKSLPVPADVATESWEKP